MTVAEILAKYPRMAPIVVAASQLAKPVFTLHDLSAVTGISAEVIKSVLVNNAGRLRNRGETPPIVCLTVSESLQHGACPSPCPLAHQHDYQVRYRLTPEFVLWASDSLPLEPPGSVP